MNLLIQFSLILLTLVQASPTLFNIDPSRVLSDTLDYLNPNPYLEIHEQYYDASVGKHRKLCVLHPVEEGTGFDDDNFLKAFDECGNGGIIRLPDANYTINSPLKTKLNNAVLDVHGWISFSTDIDHWVKNRIPTDFQNLALGWVIEGSNYVLDGHGTGGIYGNGQVWYSWAKDEGNKYGRPMSFAIVHSENVTIQNWSVIQPQFWASFVIRSKNVLYKNYYVNATQYDPDPAAASHELSWLQNTDGCDTYLSHNVTFDGMIYQGGDDCLAFKPNSSMIIGRNITCYGTTGLAYGSIAQYDNREDWLVDIDMKDIRILPSSQHRSMHGLYFKSWIGYSDGTPPNGGGGGKGYTKGIRIENVELQNVTRPIFLQTDLIYDLDKQGEGRDTGLFEWKDIKVKNVTGISYANRAIWIDCGKKTPCLDIHFENVNIKPGKDDIPEIHYVCNNIVLGGDDGLTECHPSKDEREWWHPKKA